MKAVMTRHISKQMITTIPNPSISISILIFRTIEILNIKKKSYYYQRNNQSSLNSSVFMSKDSIGLSGGKSCEEFNKSIENKLQMYRIKRKLTRDIYKFKKNEY